MQTTPRSSHEDQTDMLDPDVRFLLANERTLLAWIRTAIALIAGGVALAHTVRNQDVEYALAIGIVALGATTVGIGYRRFIAAEAAIRQARLPKRGLGVVFLSVGVGVLSVLLIVAMLLLPGT